MCNRHRVVIGCNAHDTRGATAAAGTPEGMPAAVSWSGEAQLSLRMSLSSAPSPFSTSESTLASSTFATMICPTSVLTSE